MQFNNNLVASDVQVYQLIHFQNIRSVIGGVFASFFFSWYISKPRVLSFVHK